MKPLAQLFLIMILPLFLASQESITLAALYQMADSTWPATKQTEISRESLELRDAILKTSLYPRFDLNGGASWQSDVTEIPINLPFLTLPDVPHDNYRLTADISQVIYDGGLNRSQRNMEKLTLGIEQAGVERDMVLVKERINELFFSILIFQKKNELLVVLKSDLEKKLSELTSAVDNGVILRTDADLIRAEILKTEQAIAENDFNEAAALKMLGILAGKEISDGSTLIPPQNKTGTGNITLKRPELKLFTLQQDKLGLYQNLLKSKRLPKLGAYGQAGYGKPGLNMLNDQFDTWVLVGAKLSWNIWDWKQIKNEKHLAELGIKSLALQKQATEMNFTMQAERFRQEIEKYMSLVKSDAEIIQIREEVAAVASSQLTNGIIRSSDYLREKNAALQAAINLEIHKLLLVKARTDFNAVLGEFSMN